MLCPVSLHLFVSLSLSEMYDVSKIPQHNAGADYQFPLCTALLVSV